MTKYKISNEAGKDLEKIWLYTFETWSREQADRYLKQIFEEIEYITVNPMHGQDFNYLRVGYLKAKVKHHFIFYTIDKKDSLVNIIRILHQKMNIENRL